MTAHSLPATQTLSPYKATYPVRFVTATSLFDGHDASINVIRRLLQSSGAEVIHLGHNRSVREIVTAAIQEDAQAIAVSSYQGGHIEFFLYMRQLLEEQNAGHIRVFGGGGGVIVPREIAQLQAAGIERIYSPEDGRRMGLQGMIDDMLKRSDHRTLDVGFPPTEELIQARNPGAIARAITAIEMGESRPAAKRQNPLRAPVLGLTGTGGAGKSSLTDELILRFLHDFENQSVAVLAVDPTRRRSGGALLGDRIRLNALLNHRVFMRSLATRGRHSELSQAVPDAIELLQAAGFDLIVVETGGIGQGDSEIVEVADLSVLVMTAEFGASTQLEKIDMLDFADLVVINKFDKRGSLDALRAVRKQFRRNRSVSYDIPDEQLPIYGTIASRFNDPGVTALYLSILEKLAPDWSQGHRSRFPRPPGPATPAHNPIIPEGRERYLSEIADTCRTYRAATSSQADVARQAQSLQRAMAVVRSARPSPDRPDPTQVASLLEEQMHQEMAALTEENRCLLEGWDDLVAEYSQEQVVYTIRGQQQADPLYNLSLAGTRIPRVVLPVYADWGDRLTWLKLENVPGRFPYTAGVFPFKRKGEEPKRQFAGEGPPERTNRRFHYLCNGEPAKRLSTAFDSVTLYGEDPDERPDIYGKIGESGVSICTIEDIRKLYAGFDLCSPSTSVSMTINGPAPIMLAMFMNVAVDQQVEKFEAEEGRKATDQERKEIAARTLNQVRGTVQADILKEDQAQNTCIFSTEFALKMMGDIQEFFVENDVRNYYSVSVSGYHIAEAGANPITQLAFTLANGFTYVEYYLGRGMEIDSFAPNLSFFFSNGLDIEYSVLGRVARRIWSVAMRERYGADERSQKLKYHIQTSGRSLHAQEVNFNDIRTTLQALLALADNCNSLHTNAYDEAVTTPTEESVRRAMAIQLIINHEYGMSLNENPNQGSLILELLTDLVEEAVLQEFDEISRRGGVLGAMEREYQRGKIQDESLLYENRKHSGQMPIIGVNTFLPKDAQDFDSQVDAMQLTRATPEEKRAQLDNLRAFQQRHADACPAALKRLQEVAVSGSNLFAELMQTVRVASLGQITRALYQVGGQYRRNM
ncbi:MAG: methylmalonyl-CoA mutase family protein [Bradymonadales bacterium]|nr:methylmalonyl-CoA mutase family protein [Bradymonadales bacterium]